MDSVGESLRFQVLMLPYYVGVGDQSLDAILFPHLPWFDGSQIRIDYWKQHRSVNHAMFGV